MKHLMNDLSAEEKNRILGQYNNSFIIDTSKFNKLMESKSGDVKPLINEQNVVNPVILKPGETNNVAQQGLIVPQDLIDSAPVEGYIVDGFIQTFTQSGFDYSWELAGVEGSEQLNKIKHQMVGKIGSENNNKLQLQIGEFNTELKMNISINDSSPQGTWICIREKKNTNPIIVFVYQSKNKNKPKIAAYNLDKQIGVSK